MLHSYFYYSGYSKLGGKRDTAGTVNGVGNNAAALRRDAHTWGFWWVGGGGGVLRGFLIGRLCPASQHITATAIVARDFLIGLIFSPTATKNNKASQKMGNKKQDRGIKPRVVFLASSQDARLVTR